MAKKKSNKRGLKTEYLKINGKWQNAVNKAFKKKKPKKGWPKERS